MGDGRQQGDHGRVETRRKRWASPASEIPLTEYGRHLFACHDMKLKPIPRFLDSKHRPTGSAMQRNAEHPMPRRESLFVCLKETPWSDDILWSRRLCSAYSTRVHTAKRPALPGPLSLRAPPYYSNRHAARALDPVRTTKHLNKPLQTAHRALRPPHHTVLISVVEVTNFPDAIR